MQSRSYIHILRGMNEGMTRDALSVLFPFFFMNRVDPPVRCEIAFRRTREQEYTHYVPLLVAKKIVLASED